MFSLALMLQEHAEAEGALGPFTLEPGLIIWTWIVFLALFLMLRKFAWPHIVRLTEEREQAIQRQLAEAERLNEEAKATLDKHNMLLAEAKDQAHELVADLRREAVDLSLAAAAKLIQQKIGDESDRKIVEQYLATLEDKS
jgi:F-type H+-transporting ATPase subunit b